MTIVTLNWTLPTTRTDGSPLAPTDIASIDVFDSASPTPTVPIASLPGAVTTFTSGVLSVGAHGFTIVINDTTGHSSAQSNVFSGTVAPTLAPPSAVTDLTGTFSG